jgi:nucleoside phosphorylase
MVVGLLGLQALQLAPAVASAGSSCAPRLLVLASMPSELGPLLAAAKLDPGQPVTRAGRHFFVGTLEGKRVILGMVGTGLVNSRQMAEAAFSGFHCGTASIVSGVVYSGVAGAGQGSAIGDVTVPSQWTLDNGKTWLPADPRMLARVQAVVNSGAVKLEKTTPLGSPGCACPNPDLVKTVTLTHTPSVIVGGRGQSYDTFNGKAFPCVPAGGDVFGCEPCAYTASSTSDTHRTLADVVPFLTLQAFLSNLGPAASPSEKNYEASDNETAATHLVAVQHKTPFIAFRAISDGTPDPLMLPGYPSQFFVYYQLAAENAAIAARAFIRHWSGG